MSVRKEIVFSAVRRVCGFVLSATLLGCASNERVNIGLPPDSGTRPVDSAAGTAPASRAGNGGLSVQNPGSPPAQPGVKLPGPSAAGSAATPPPKPISIDDTGSNNSAGLPADEVKKLMTGGPTGAMKWLYPYDGTVFPRGTVAPLVMWHSEGAPDVVYLQIRSKTFSYKAVLKPSVEGALFTPDGSVASVLGVTANLLGAEVGTQVAIPQEVWELAGRQSQGKHDPFTLEITERVGDRVHGPLSVQIKIAEASIKGSVYYNACVSGSGTAGGLGSGFGSRVMRIPPGGNAEFVSSDAQCVGCHSVSADGSRLVAQRSNWVQDILTTFNMNVAQGLSYQIDAGGKLQPITGTTMVR